MDDGADDVVVVDDDDDDGFSSGNVGGLVRPNDAPG